MSALLCITCPKCTTKQIVFTEINAGTGQLSHDHVLMETKPARKGRSISMNEVLDMHNFLKNWQDGDIANFFKE